MKKILVITEEIAQHLNQLWNWARCEASTAVALPIWNKIINSLEDEKEKAEEKIGDDKVISISSDKQKDS